eukprot:TRINITY_DN1620_c0_g1_i5.p2 TRINITY_DN1620_c0_g1~~TRINITY_DN1620_c0_g1_i5.p2  ORF type:complete len:311 (+),score=47.23 TRINITY_DN1620_c0_g1_i5:183-1115(+)
MVRDKGVAYVKFDRASTAAKAMEELNGIVLNDGRGPQLKVLQAESPNNRGSPRQPSLDELYQDPVNHPPRSRLFLVVPRTADESVLQEEMSKYEGMEYCKTDLISTKGIAFAKYSKASQALAAMEDINKTNMLANYRIKCMLAEPKLRRGAQPRADLGALGLPGDSLFLQGMDPSGGGIGNLDQLLQQGSLDGLAPPGTPPLSSFSGLGGMDQMDWMSQLNGLNMNTLVDIPQQTLDPFLFIKLWLRWCIPKQWKLIRVRSPQGITLQRILKFLQKLNENKNLPSLEKVQPQELQSYYCLEGLRESEQYS